jgi:YVTN family beta-propeller protein
MKMRIFLIVFLTIFPLVPHAEDHGRTGRIDGTGDSLHYKSPVGVVVSRDGNYLYVTCKESSSLIVVDLPSGSVKHEIPVGHYPYWVTEHPDGQRVYVSNRWSNSVSVIDAATSRVT